MQASVQEKRLLVPCLFRQSLLAEIIHRMIGYCDEEG